MSASAPAPRFRRRHPTDPPTRYDISGTQQWLEHAAGGLGHVCGDAHPLKASCVSRLASGLKYRTGVGTGYASYISSGHDGCRQTFG
jgi:hypothetical protein